MNAGYVNINFKKTSAKEAILTLLRLMRICRCADVLKN